MKKFIVSKKNFSLQLYFPLLLALTNVLRVKKVTENLFSVKETSFDGALH